MTGEGLPTERDFDLIDVALDAAANSCQSGATLRGSRVTDPLAAEYVHALHAIRRLRTDARSRL